MKEWIKLLNTTHLSLLLIEKNHLIIFLIEFKILSDSSFILLNKNHIELSSHKRILRESWLP